MIETAQPEDRAAALRAAFDGQFAAAPAVATLAGERLLVIGFGAERLLLHLAHIAGLYVDRRVVTVPRAHPALLGITGLRGAILPVYSLDVALGRPGDAAARWLVTSASAPLAFAFAHFDRHVEIARDRILPRGDTGHLREAATMGDETLPIVDLPSLAAQL